MPVKDLIFKEINAAGDFIYENVKSGMDESRKSKVAGAKGNLEDSSAENLITNQPGVIQSDFNKISNKGVYSEMHQTAKYEVKEGDFVGDNKAPRSAVNKWSLIKYRGGPASLEDGTKGNTAKVYKGKGKVPINPTAKVIIHECSNITNSPGYQYSLADFIFCEYYGKVPNNQLLTLRRFPFPVEDNIISPKGFDGATGKEVNKVQPALATALTWMSPHIGNELKNILKFSVGFNWEDNVSQLQEIKTQSRDRGFIGGFMDGIVPDNIQGVKVQGRFQGGAAGESYETTKRRLAQGENWDPLKQTYPNHSLYPLNIIDRVYARKHGLKFDQSFELVFNYDLKGIPGTSPKVAFLDVLANLLVLTYNNAPFWGGNVRYTGGGKIRKPLGDLQKLRKGDYKGFLGSIINDLSSSVTSGIDDILKGGDSKILNNIGGGALMDLVGGPQGGEIVQAFLTGDATGQWHLTVGNPLNPMAVIGNLCLEKADFEFDGPLGYEDFPTKLTVKIELKPGRPRDKADIESMFNAGKGRLYVAEEGVMDASKTYDVDPYGKVYGDKSGGMQRKAAKFTNG